MLVDLFYYRNLDEEQTKEVAEDNVEVEEELAEVLIFIDFLLICLIRVKKQAIKNGMNKVKQVDYSFFFEKYSFVC